MKIIEWNIHQRANHINTEDIPPFIAQAVWGEDPDFLVLTECYKVKHWDYFLGSLGNYDLFVSDNSSHHQNEVVIGVKKMYEGARVVNCMESGYENLNPNFLHVTVPMHGQDLSIMGARIRVPKITPTSIESQTYRLNQLDLMIDQMSETPAPAILVGDFNNYRRGLSPETLEMKRDPKYSKCALWNMSVLRERFEEVGYTMHTPEGFSYGWENPNIKYQIAQDHAFTKGVEIATNDLDGTKYLYYVDEFMNLAPDIYDESGIKGVITPNPNHKMLVVEFDMFDLI